MGQCMSSKSVSQQQPKLQKIQNIDTVKAKLKIARDRINNIISAKNRDITNINIKLNEKIPIYQQTGNKKQLLPLLKTKKDLFNFIGNAQVRLKLINQKISQVEIQQINLDTVNALENANQYIKIAQTEMENRDWRNILEEAKNKYQLQWPEEQEQIQNDPKFQALWEEVGGNKIPAKKQVQVNIPQQQNIVHNSQKIPTQNQLNVIA